MGALKIWSWDLFSHRLHSSAESQACAPMMSSEEALETGPNAQLLSWLFDRQMVVTIVTPLGHVWCVLKKKVLRMEEFMAVVWLCCSVPVFLSFENAEKPKQHMNINFVGTLCPRSRYFYLVRPRHGQWECRCSTLERPPQPCLVARCLCPVVAQTAFFKPQMPSKVTIVREALQKLIWLFPHALCLSIFVRTFIAIMQHNIMHPQEKCLTLYFTLPSSFTPENHFLTS